MRVIVYTDSVGLIVVRPASKEMEELAWKKLSKEAINPRWIDDSELPPNRDFRNAWVDSQGVKVDMPKAREIHRNRLRELRAPKLKELDVEYQRADEIGDALWKARVSAKKQALRDVPADPRIEAAQTPEALSAVLPDALK